jgi:glyoxylase-like metal-dependent hydrolase (beta-lactamase superfamily II)
MIMKIYVFTFTVFMFLFFMDQSLAQQTVLTFETGDCRVSVLSEGGRNAESTMLAGATPEILGKYLPSGTFLLEIQAFLIRFPDKNVLIDTGVGKNLSANLKSLGLTENQVQIILLTHAHGDHIGGLLLDGKQAFPNAELYISKAEYDYWTNEKERGDNARKVFEAYKDKLHLFVPSEPENEIPDLIPGVKPVAAYGHTPGHTAFLLESAGKKLLFWGDITHATAVQMPHPEVTLSFDNDRQQAAQTRKKILEYVLHNKISVAGAHIAMPAIGNIKTGKDEGYEFTPICTCEAI